MCAVDSGVRGLTGCSWRYSVLVIGDVTVVVAECSRGSIAVVDDADGINVKVVEVMGYL